MIEAVSFKHQKLDSLERMFGFWGKDAHRPEGAPTGDPSRTGGKAGVPVRALPSGKCDGSAGNQYNEKDDIFVRIGRWASASVDKLQIGNT
jgi:hypothetical protein